MANILNYDLSFFIQRTLIKFATEYNCNTYESLESLLLQDETLIHTFDKLFVNVSEMFRDPKVLKKLEKN